MKLCPPSLKFVCFRLFVPIAVLCLQGHAFGSQFVLIARNAQGVYQFTEADILTVNNSEKVRVSSQGSSTATIDPKQIGHFPEERLSSFLVIRAGVEGLTARSEAGGAWITLIPQGKEVKDQAGTPAQMWSHSTLAIKKDKSQKTADAVSLETLYAIVRDPSPSDGAVKLASQIGWLRSPDDALPLRAAIVKAYPGSPAAEKLRTATIESMEGDRKTWAGGGASRATIDHWLQVAHAADVMFPSDAAVKSLTAAAYREDALRARQTAILRALDAGEQADAFLLRYGTFEPFQHYADPLMDARRRNYSLSASLHNATALSLKNQKNYAGALAEFRFASHRDPNLQTALNGVEEMRLELARISSLAAAEKRKGADLRSHQLVQVQRHVLMAEQYLHDSKAGDSQKELDAAQAIDADAAGVVLTQAKLYAAQGQLGKALAVMDRYAGVAATDQEFSEGEKYRATLNFDLQKQKAALKGKLATEFRTSKFSSALQTAAAGLNLDLEDTDFQYYAGLSACILRRCDRGVPLLKRYLDGTDTLGGNPDTRLNAILLTQAPPPAKPASAPAPADGQSQLAWLSGTRVPVAAMYDPMSLAFLPKVSQVKASDKLTVNYEWAGPSLRAVHSIYEDKHTGTNILSGIAAGLAAASNTPAEFTMLDSDKDANDFFFEYASDIAQVSRVTKQETKTVGGATQMNISMPVSGTALAPADIQTYSTQPDERRDSSQGFLTLWNSPHVDTALAFQLTGKRIAVGFSGNRFFHPFVWDGIHLFELDYDQLGRVRYAWEMGKSAGRLDFEWEGSRLLSVRQHSRNDGSGDVTYSRTLSYSGDRLMSEAIEYQGRASKIEYRYDKRGVLMEADCTNDGSLDNRSRKVAFLQ